MPKDKSFSKQVGRNVAMERKELGMNQAALAKKIGVSQQNITSYERGRLRIPLDLLPPLARALKTTVPKLLGYED